MASKLRKNSQDKRALLANVALLYYGEGLTQNDIASRIDVARTTVVNLLKEAREEGVVDIRVDGKSLASSTASLRLRDKYGLEEVYIASTLNEAKPNSPEEVMRQLGRVGSTALSETIQQGDRLGIAWGLPVQAVADQMLVTETPGVEVYQMIGSLISDFVPASEKCSIDIATKLGAPCYTLHAPALASTVEVAAILEAEPTIKAQLAALKTLDTAVVSIGDVTDTTPMALSGMVTRQELARARSAGAVGILCCRYIDRNGDLLSLPPDDRIIAARLDDIRRARRRLMVVGGDSRVEATRAAIKGGYVTHLCTDKSLAEMLLTDPSNEPAMR
ncbi:sugar-binding transcriptional regulator [uncultured Roseobacter sp.]|uniref:sugar-binding transcriptional regulator n=1 Tax=uncultured Roseobacter sp. TaxID=114847 RepID=UPI002615BD85|nr:sugar-binding transcriptional regulator [uncultured Roseobacter sp.]